MGGRCRGLGGSRPRPARASAVAVLVLFLVVLGACGGGTREATEPADPVLKAGHDLYRSVCAACHGDDGDKTGSPIGGDAIVERYPDVDALIEVVRSGRGSMPSFADSLSDAQVESVVRYLREGLDR